MSMIERVAKALCKADCADGGHYDASDECAKACSHWQAFDRQARAAIQAMRTLNDNMLGKVDEVDLFAWEHIIDAILSEGTTAQKDKAREEAESVASPPTKEPGHAP